MTYDIPQKNDGFRFHAEESARESLEDRLLRLSAKLVSSVDYRCSRCQNHILPSSVCYAGRALICVPCWNAGYRGQGAYALTLPGA